MIEGANVIGNIRLKLSQLLTILQRKAGPQDGSADLSVESLQQVMTDLDQYIQDESADKEALRNRILQVEQRFEHTILQAPVGIVFLKGRKLVAEMANDTYLSIVDRNREDFIGRPLFETQPEVRKSIESIMEMIFETGYPYYGYEFEVDLKRSGTIRKSYFNFVYQPIRDVDGHIDGILVVANDVTDQVLSMHLLQQSEKKFRNLVDQSPVATTILQGPDFVITLANKAMLEKIWQRDPGDIIGKQLAEAFPELKNQSYYNFLETVMARAQPVRNKENTVYIEGSKGRQLFYLDFEFNALLDTDNKVYGVLATVYDVTEVTLFRHTIEAAEKRFKLLADSMPQLVWTADARGSLNYHSQSFFTFSGLKPGEADEDGWFRIVHPADRESNDKSWKKSITEGEEFYFEHRFKRQDGLYRWYLSRAVPLKNETGDIQLWVGTSTDIHQKKLFTDNLENIVAQRTRELDRINKDLVRSNNDLLQFAYVASHDLQEPLRKIQVFLSAITHLEEASQSPRAKDYFERVQNAAGKMQHLIVDLLAYSRINSSRPEMMDHVDLNTLLAGVIEQLKETIGNIRAELKIGRLPTCQVIPFQFEQLFTNLIGNSLKFGRPGQPPVIRIEASLIPGSDLRLSWADPSITYHVITVSDNGIGFKNQYATRIFEVFQRLPTREKIGGTGIGLAICKSIVENHQGHITAEGTPDQGCTFTIYLPDNSPGIGAPDSNSPGAELPGGLT